MHLRLRLGRLAEGLVEDSSGVGAADVGCAAASLPADPVPPAPDVPEAQVEPALEVSPLEGLSAPCLACVVAYLPLAEILAVRTCAQEPLQWAMDHAAEEESGPQHRVYDRIRARLWLRRVEDITAGTKDESIFETRMRSLADEALRSRMETEMQESLRHMEEQIHQFQSEVDRRLEDQERQVRRMVEERVQQELDTILANEMVKVQAMVEERLRERVGQTFRREVRETVRELKHRLDTLVQENELLSDAFAEANFRAKCLFWASLPPLSGVALLGGGAGAQAALWPLQRRVMVAISWQRTLERHRGASVGAETDAADNVANT
eukprot:TRINITY_DN31287_c0_g1_i1.p1 TRINITY_DN31287_c0_g1~~TRINITY_DN31287_c0_g1_i1.p1  ORF type:complete len:377 (-),score=88.86 TRINITY_DN31287_c0_g1_i1:129-1097(-)